MNRKYNTNFFLHILDVSQWILLQALNLVKKKKSKNLMIKNREKGILGEYQNTKNAV